MLDGFNSGFERVTGRYVMLLKMIANRSVITFDMLALFCFAIWTTGNSLPSGFIPAEDQGMIYAIIQTPPGATLERTNDIARELQKITEEVEGVESVSALAGYEVLTEGRGSNAGTCLINLKNWSERQQL